MQKDKLLEQIRRQATKGGVGTADDLKRISLRECELAAENIWADMLFLLLKDSQSIDYFIKSYDNSGAGIDIQYDRDTKEYYVEIPIKITQLPQNKGVHLVRGLGTNTKFLPTTNEDVDLFVDMDAMKYYDKILYVLEGTSRIKLLRFDYASKNCRKVQLKLIPSFSEYAFTDDVPIPSGRITEFTNMVAKYLFSSKRILDTSNDGVSL